MITATLIFLVAFLYASVGHGGASGYLAILTLFAYSSTQMASSALVLNVFVAGIAAFSFWRAGFFSVRFIAPFLVGSVPFAFFGGWLKVSPHIYSGLLAFALIIAAVRLFNWNGGGGAESLSAPSIPAHELRRAPGRPANGLPPNPHTPPPSARFVRGDTRLARLNAMPVMIGSGIGFVSGVVGVGGGIFLSPLLLFFRWATVKQTAAVSAFFIVINSLAGIFGRAVAGQWNPTLVVPFVLPAVVGGIAGSWMGAHKFSSLTLRRLLAIVLLVAAWKAFRMAVG